MLTSLRSTAALAFCLLAMPAVYANELTFRDLLARAEQEAAAGRRWEPPGDNLADTVMTLFARISTATPEELSSFAALLERDRQNMEPALPPNSTEGNTGSATPAPVRPSAPVLPADTRSATTRFAPSPPPAAPAPTVLPAPVQVPPSARAANLFARGQAAETEGDISAARRYYSTAAKEGHALAARNLGRLYDPIVLGRMVIGGLDADPKIARQWYERAAALGDPEAITRLQTLAEK